MIIVKRLINYLISFKGKLILEKKINKIFNLLQVRRSIAGKNINAHKTLWSQIGSNPNTKWYKTYYSINGIEDPRYITEFDYYHKVEPTLNNRTFGEAYSDKNIYHVLLDNSILPIVFLRNIQGEFYDENYVPLSKTDEVFHIIPPQAKKILVKKSINTGGGKGIELFSKINDIWQDNHKNVLTLSYLNQKFNRDYVVQEYIEQHAFYGKFNSSSVNTIRLMTYRTVASNQIVPLQAVLRIGKIGSFVDNQASGGISIGIQKDGKLNSFAVNKMGHIITSYNNIDFSTLGQAYKFQEIVQVGLKVAEKYFYHRLLGFDFCLDSNENIKLIEINNRNNEINFFQMNNGPLFREYTDEILKYCTTEKKTISFDFEL